MEGHILKTVKVFTVGQGVPLVLQKGLHDRREKIDEDRDLQVFFPCLFDMGMPIHDATV